MASPPAATPSTQGERGGRRRHYRRPRRGGAQNNGVDGPAPVAQATQEGAQPNTIPQSAQLPPQAAARDPAMQSNQSASNNQQPGRNADASESSRGNGRRGRRGGRGGRQPRDTPNRQVMGGLGGRSFGGQLTTAQSGSALANPALHPDAPAFTPGQPVAHRPAPASHSRQNAQQSRQRAYSKSQADDIATRTHEDIMHGVYECPICTSEVLKNSKVWNCKTCWTVFHLTCVKKWAKNEGSTQRNQQEVPEGELPPERQWRCPGCNLPKDDMPNEYTCWCAKEINPKAIPGLPPHSCGQTCGKPKKCPHPCDVMCHAGPCPPCPRMGPKTACFCGSRKVQKKCVDTDYEHGWSCGKRCGKMLACGEHECERGCHEGPCGKCEVPVEAKCYCGKVDKLVSCSERGKKMQSSLPTEDGDINSWVGSFACGNVCKRAYDCGKHFCDKTCHSQHPEPAVCPKSPRIVTNCPCGKTRLSEMGCVRSSCEDPIPHCEKICRKRLPCGHECRELCHEGQCGSCFQFSDIDCRCGRTTSRTMCHQGHIERPQCMRICRAVLNCGRHECGERCCSGEKAAAERLKAQKKSKGPARNSAEDFEAQHICTRTCGRELKCGNPEHVCQDLCHRGPCRSCREAVFEEIACNCGKTILYPPQPCGTQPPPCPHPCKRPKTCGHPQVNHPCHGDNESCPKCPYLVQKKCMCGKKNLNNQPCGSTSVSCGEVCGQKLRCGLHLCRKTCHRAGDCEDAALAHCAQQCGKPKTAEGCGHACRDPCHAPYPCKEDKPCQAKVIITCACQHLKQEVKCNATKANPVLERKVLTCDDECLRLQRNAKLASALNIAADHTDSHIPYSTATLDYFRDHVKWCQTQEREFRVFAADDKEKSLRFKPMQAAQRAFLHSLAEDFGLDSEGVDPEPHRHVVVFKAPKFVKAPMKTLSQCVKPKTVVAEEKTAKATSNAAPFNAIILSAPRFALTIDELKSALVENPATAAAAAWKIEFLPSEEIVLHGSLADGVDEAVVTRLKPFIAEIVKSRELAKSTALCAVDASLNVVRRETDMAASAGGWSQVVKGGGALKQAPAAPTLGSKSVFAVLGKSAEKKRILGKKEIERKRKEAEESLAENWEDAVDEMGEDIVPPSPTADKGKGKEKEVESESGVETESRTVAEDGAGGSSSLGEPFVVVEASGSEKKIDGEEA